ncbi:MAG TPA: cell division protein ZipA C-terminal FtsZ-binding domain-containing protein [Steroidobacteraceae bacterium]|nr:cell division protein ZipA C-terminal FtsZ-binding domain-containing protein [Steroidobacteraceae bacterium]
MGELRFILLIAGLVFLVALTAWELRRPRQAHRDSQMRGPTRNEPELGSFAQAAADAPALPAARAGAAASQGEGRRPVMSLPPRIDLPAIEAIRDQSIMAEADALHMFETQAMLGTATPQIDVAAASTAASDLSPPPAPLPAPGSAPIEHGVPLAGSGSGSAETSAQAAADGSPHSAPIIARVPLVVEWPPEGERHIVALRIVAACDERLSGRAVRLAITGCGFVHGRFGIYHQPDADGRALLSVASLSKPGILDPVNMDFQRLSGISLFSVLPGPLPPAAALDHLIDTARELSQRLAARVQDEHGQPLDAGRLEDLRDSMQSLSMQTQPRPGLQAEPAA